MMKASKWYDSVILHVVIVFISALLAMVLCACSIDMKSAVEDEGMKPTVESGDIITTSEANKVSTKVGEEQVFQDAQLYYESLLTTDGMQVISLNIYDRKTDSSNRTDKVFVELVSENDVCSVTNRISLEYYRYDDGWDLEDSQHISRNTVLMNTSISFSIAQNDLLQSPQYSYYGEGEVNYVSNTIDLNEGYDTYYFDIRNRNGYCIENYSAVVTYVFSGISWSLDKVEINKEKFEWDILGEWHHNSGNANIWVNILSIDGSSYEMEYEIQYNYSGWYSSGVRKVISNGIRFNYGEDSTDIDRNHLLQIDLNGYDEDGNYVDAGWIEVYPDFGLRWKSIDADGDPFYLTSGPGLHGSESNKVPLSSIFAIEIDALDYWDQTIADLNGNTYFGYCDLESYRGMYQFDTEIVYKLGCEYDVFSGTFFCDPENNEGDTIRVEIYCDGELTFSTGELIPASPVMPFTMDVSGVEEIKIWARSDCRISALDWDHHIPSVILTDAYVEKESW